PTRNNPVPALPRQTGEQEATMRHRYLGPVSILVALAATAALSSTLAGGQDPQPASRRSAAVSRGTAPRTPWGDPDLQGRWTNTTTTPLERPSDLAGKQVLTPEERAQRDASAAGGGDYKPRPGDTGAYNAFWMEPGKASAQTSLIVDPPDGKLPSLTP